MDYINILEKMRHFFCILKHTLNKQFHVSLRYDSLKKTIPLPFKTKVRHLPV